MGPTAQVAATEVGPAVQVAAAAAEPAAAPTWAVLPPPALLPTHSPAWQQKAAR